MTLRPIRPAMTVGRREPKAKADARLGTPEVPPRFDRFRSTPIGLDACRLDGFRRRGYDFVLHP